MNLKSLKPADRLFATAPVWALTLANLLFPGDALAKPRPAMPPMPEFAPVLYHASFDAAYSCRMTNAQVSIANYGELIESWSGYALQRAGAKVTPFIVPAVDAAGHTNVAGESGVARFWLRVYWASSPNGSGPGTNARLLEMVPMGGREFWSLRITPDGSVIYLVGESHAGPAVLLKAPIAWEAGQWHLVTLDYGKTTALFLDGELVAEGAGTLAAPPSVAQMVVGSTVAGADTLGGEVEELSFFGRSRFRPLPTEFAVKSYYGFASGQAALGVIAPEEEQARRDARRQQPIAGVEGLAAASPEGGGNSPAGLNFGPSDLWLEIFYGTNSAPITLHNTTNGVRYQLLSRPEVARPPWLVEQTLFGAAGTNTTTTVPFNERPILFFWAGVDSDGDGLIDYLETLNGTDPQNPDSDFDGVNDYVEVIQGRNPIDPNGAVPDTSGLVNLKVYTPLK